MEIRIDHLSNRKLILDWSRYPKLGISKMVAAFGLYNNQLIKSFFVHVTQPLGNIYTTTEK